MISDFSALAVKPAIVSGLAVGIDAAAHRAALKCGLPTAAVLAHGLDIVYPAHHKRLLDEMLYAGGGAISDYVSGTNIHPANFLSRNRIIAGIADAVVVAESALKGGSLSTARLAMEYSRDVFTFPARIDDKNSAGCNALIRDNKAGLATCAADITLALRWDVIGAVGKQGAQAAMFADVNLTSDEEKLYKLLRSSGAQNIDDICRMAAISTADASVALLTLEFNGMVRALPGKVFEAVG
jgi:DNA processing protein